MNEKVVALVLISLVTGIAVGYGLGYTIYQPSILRLESEVTNLQSEVSTLTTNYTTLNTTYNELQGNYGILNVMYNELEGNYSLLTETIDVRLIDVCTPAWLIRIERMNTCIPYTMYPTLKYGDVVVVRKVITPFSDLTCDYTNGTIVAFWGDPVGKPGEIIVHRLVGMLVPLPVGSYKFITHGDFNLPSVTEEFGEEYLIGEVVAVISKSSE